MPRHQKRRSVLLKLALAIGLATSACSQDAVPEVDAIQMGDAWVFTYVETPDYGMQARGGGAAAVVDGCLQMGDAVVIWRKEDLEAVEDIVHSIEAGAPPNIQVGGGGMSLDEGGTRDDFPVKVLDHCSPTELWHAAEGPVVLEDGS